jgi:hypothetical protein
MHSNLRPFIHNSLTSRWQTLLQCIFSCVTTHVVAGVSIRTTEPIKGPRYLFEIHFNIILRSTFKSFFSVDDWSLVNWNGLLETLSLYLIGDAEEKHEKAGQDGMWPGWDSNIAPSEYNSRALPLDRLVRFTSPLRGAVITSHAAEYWNIFQYHSKLRPLVKLCAYALVCSWLPSSFIIIFTCLSLLLHALQCTRQHRKSTMGLSHMSRLPNYSWIYVRNNKTPGF